LNFQQSTAYYLCLSNSSAWSIPPLWIDIAKTLTFVVDNACIVPNPINAVRKRAHVHRMGQQLIKPYANNLK